MVSLEMILLADRGLQCHFEHVSGDQLPQALDQLCRGRRGIAISADNSSPQTTKSRVDTVLGGSGLGMST
jgi:hypothetical protein